MTGATPRTRVRTERRRRPLLVGVSLALLGLVAFLAGLSTVWVTQALQVAAPVARMGVPDSRSFDAEDRTYVVLVDRIASATRLGVTQGEPATNIACTAERADGTTVEVGRRAPHHGVNTDLGTAVGSFEAVEGPTSVSCVWERSASDAYRVVIAPEHREAMILGLASIAGGLATGAVGAVLVWIGFRGRAVVENADSGATDHGVGTRI